MLRAPHAACPSLPLPTAPLRSRKSGSGWSKRTEASGRPWPSTSCSTCSAPRSRTSGCRRSGEAAGLQRGRDAEARRCSCAPQPPPGQPGLLTLFPGGLRPTGWMCWRQWLQSGPAVPTAAQRPPNAAHDAKMSGIVAGEGTLGGGPLSPSPHPPLLTGPLACRECQVKHWEKHRKACFQVAGGGKVK